MRSERRNWASPRREDRDGDAWDSAVQEVAGMGVRATCSASTGRMLKKLQAGWAPVGWTGCTGSSLPCPFFFYSFLFLNCFHLFKSI